MQSGICSFQLVLIAIGSALAVGAVTTSCATTPPPKPISAEERVRRDVGVGAQLSEGLEQQLKIQKEIEVEVYLRKLATRLAEGNDTLRNSPVGVFLIKDRDAKWRSYAMPGHRIYLSTQMLKNVEFENELAAVLALQFGHVLRRHALSRLEQTPGAFGFQDSVMEGLLPLQHAEVMTTVDYFGVSGIFAFTEKDYLEATESAVDILYRAGFDTRGLIGHWNRLQANPGAAPFEPGTLEKLIEKTREVNALYTPLRNPVVRSQEFLRTRERIRKM